MTPRAIVVTDGLMIAIMLAAAALTLVRFRRLGGAPTVLAVAACVLLGGTAAAELVWYRDLPELLPRGMFTAGFGLLLLAVHLGRPPRAAPPVQAAARAGAAGGWSPPRQADPDDWNSMSGVWSIPRGTFDDPPHRP